MPKYDISEITGVIPAMLTCFDEYEEFDPVRMENLNEFLICRNVDGFYLTGSTGEGFLMDTGERKLVVETVIDKVNGRKAVIVHIGDIGTRKSVDLAVHAFKSGADVISSVPPIYFRFSEQSIFEYYRMLAESTPLPLIIYNVLLAGMMGTDLIIKLSEIENIQGIKYTGKDHDQLMYLKNRITNKFIIYSGADEMAFSGISA